MLALTECTEEFEDKKAVLGIDAQE